MRVNRAACGAGGLALIALASMCAAQSYPAKVGSTAHMGGELLKLRAGIDLQQIAYKGAVPAAATLVAGG